MAGFSEMAMYTWKSPVKLVFINANEIHSGLSDEAISKQAYDHEIPHESLHGIPATKTQVVYAVYHRKHYMFGLVNGKAIFNKGSEASQALQDILKNIRKMIPQPIDMSSIEAITDVTARQKAIRQSVTLASTRLQPAKKTKKPKRKKKPIHDNATNPTTTSTGGKTLDIQPPKQIRSITSSPGTLEVELLSSTHDSVDDNTWQVVKSKPHKTRNPRLVNAMVVYTDLMAEDLLLGLEERLPNIHSIINRTRQKKGHVILMSTSTNADTLRNCTPDLKKIGLQCKPYRIQFQGNGHLASYAKRGLNIQIQRAKICENYFRGTTCPQARKGQCPYKCYKSTITNTTTSDQ